MPSDNGHLIEQINPATGEILQRVRPTSRVEVENVVVKAGQSFLDWRSLQPSQRSKYFEKTAKAVTSNKDKIARMITLEMGKPIRESTAEVEKCAWAFEYFAENGPSLLQPETHKTDATDSYVDFQPLGV